MSVHREIPLDFDGVLADEGNGSVVRRSVLPGGVRVLTEAMPDQRSVTIGYWVAVGSRDESPEGYGATHFLEHLLFKGTPTRTAMDIAAAFDRVGGESNAGTAKESTVYHARVLDEDLPMAVEVLTDMLTSSLIDPDELETERGVILEELATYGTPTIKRAYGDWTTTNLNGWKKALNHHAIQPVQQFAYTVGKNSSDSALIIDAMDLLWMGNVDAFALVSSDSDFTRLATRLREGGKRVIGLGARKTPASLRNAVDQFIYLELLGTATDHDVDDDETGEDAPAKEENAKASEGSGRSGSRRGGRGRGRGAKTTDATDTPEATDADAEAPAVDEAPAADEAPAGDAAARELVALPGRLMP